MLNVYLTDDEPFIIEGLYDMIDWAALGMAIVGHAGNGKLALEAMEHTPVDLLITDISMPVMNGLQLIGAARERNPDLKVIVLSAYSDFDYLREGMKLGIENYLLKPINVTELKETLSNTAFKLNNMKAETFMHDYGLQLMKDNILFRWLTGTMEEKEYSERAELLGIELKGDYVAVFVIRGGAELGDRRLERVAATLDHIEDSAVFHDIEGDIVAIAGFQDQHADKSAILQGLSALNESGALKAGTFRFSAGSIYRKEQAGESYNEAKKAQEYFLVYPEQQWLDYGDKNLFRDTEVPSFPLDWAEYGKLLVARDAAKLVGKVTGDFEQLRKISGVTPSVMKDIAFEMIVRFKMELKEIKRMEEPELFASGFENVRSASDYAELSDAVRQVALRCVDSLVRDSRNPVVAQVLRTIHEHYTDELSLKTLGAQYHIHPVYLGQLFIKETNESFTEYLNKFRIEKAKEMLKTTTHKVQEIARLVGYWETGYFYKQFKKHVGVSPTDYKALL